MDEPTARQIRMSGLDRCFFCNTPFTEENTSEDHVFPESIGGWFTVDFICRDCNSRFGTTFDSDLRKSAYIHAALKATGTDSSYLKGQKINWTSPLGHSGRMGVPRGYDRPVIIPSRQKDGSVITDEQLFIESKKRALAKAGWTDAEIKEHFVDRIKSAPLETKIPIHKPGASIRESFVRHGAPLTIEFEDLNRPIRFALIAKIALELWVSFGLFRASKFDPRPLTKSILSNDPKSLVALSPVIRTDGSVYDLHFGSFHYCKFGVFRGVAVALVSLFEILVYAIALGAIIGGPNADWRSRTWVFPLSGRSDEDICFPKEPPDSLSEYNELRMNTVAGMYLHQSKTPGAPNA